MGYKWDEINVFMSASSSHEASEALSLLTKSNANNFKNYFSQILLIQNIGH